MRMTDPLTTFPEEIWAIILRMVEDLEDLISCSRTCVLWNSLLFKTATNWKFQLIFPCLYPYLSRQDMFNCRLVSTHWSKGVDNYLVSDHHERIVIDALRDPPHFLRSLSTGPLSEYNPSSLPFISYFENNRSRNPFPSRAVHLERSSYDENVPDPSLEFLKIFGMHIWSLRIRLSGITNRDAILIKILRDIWDVLACVPNLKNLCIDNVYTHLYRPENHDVTKFVETHEAPKLPHIKFVETHLNNRQLDSVLLSAYSGPSVTTIHSRSPLCVHASICGHGYNRKWQRHLVLHFGCYHFPDRHPDWKADIDVLNNFNFPLKSLRLLVPSCENLLELLGCLVKFRSSLREIRIIFCLVTKFDWVRDIRYMTSQIDQFYSDFLYKMDCLTLLDMDFRPDMMCPDNIPDHFKGEVTKFVDKISNADWMTNYTKMGGQLRIVIDREFKIRVRRSISCVKNKGVDYL